MCFLGLALVFSARASIGITTTVWENELGWSRGFISSGAALALLSMAAVSPVVGLLVGKFGPRRLIAAGLMLCATGITLMAVLPSKATYLIGFGILAGASFGVVAVHLVSTVVAHLFEQRRGLATGIATAGATGGQIVVVPPLGYLVDTYTWQVAFLAVAGLLAALAVATMVVLPNPAVGAKRSSGIPAREQLAFLVRAPAFHILFWSFFICGITTSGAIETHFIPYAMFCGFPSDISRLAYGVLAFVNMLAMMTAGYLSDKINRPLLLGSIYVLRGFSFIVLLYLGTDPVLLFVFAVMFGIFDYATVPVTASLAASHLGLERMGLAMGLIAGGHALGGALGAYAGGALFDLYARYDEFWYATIATAIAAGLMVYLLRETRKAPVSAGAAS